MLVASNWTIKSGFFFFFLVVAAAAVLSIKYEVKERQISAAQIKEKQNVLRYWSRLNFLDFSFPPVFENEWNNVKGTCYYLDTLFDPWCECEYISRSYY